MKQNRKAPNGLIQFDLILHIMKAIYEKKKKQKSKKAIYKEEDLYSLTLKLCHALTCVRYTFRFLC